MVGTSDVSGNNGMSKKHWFGLSPRLDRKKEELLVLDYLSTFCRLTGRTRNGCCQVPGGFRPFRVWKFFPPPGHPPSKVPRLGEGRVRVSGDASVGQACFPHPFSLRAGR